MDSSHPVPRVAVCRQMRSVPYQAGTKIMVTPRIFLYNVDSQRARISSPDIVNHPDKHEEGSWNHGQAQEILIP